MNNIFIAFYRGKKPYKHGKSKIKTLWFRFLDRLTRFFTNGRYSHCEVAIKDKEGTYSIYSASVRDKGVRVQHHKELTADQWTLVPVQLSEEEVIKYFEQNKGKNYDFFGAIGCAVTWIDNSSKRMFCSEFCAGVLGYDEPWRFDPNELYSILTRRTY
jgi:hypothetical protein|nr:MAG TPA: cysteine peptidase [Caudoviricetes sp.]